MPRYLKHVTWRRPNVFNLHAHVQLEREYVKSIIATMRKNKYLKMKQCENEKTRQSLRRNKKCFFSHSIYPSFVFWTQKNVETQKHEDTTGWKPKPGHDINQPP